MKINRNLINFIPTCVLRIVFVFVVLLFLQDRQILLPLLSSLFSGQILFSAKFWTFTAVMVALFGVRFNDWLNRPIMSLDFDPNSDRCCRSAVLSQDTIQDFGIFNNVTRQYFRLKVSNIGKSTAKKIRITVDLYYEDGKEAERFEPTCLSWLTREREIDIAGDEVTYINLFSQVIGISETHTISYPKGLFVIRWQVYDTTPRGIAWDRERRIFNIKLVVHGDNVGAKTFWFKFIPEGDDIFKPGKLLKLNE